MSSEIELSIVVPVYNEENNILKLYDEIVEVLDSNLIWEITFVDDGSADRSWDNIKCLYKDETRVRGLKFSRNFGHQYALFAGISTSKGKAVITMDADLQHPPEVIPKLLIEWEKGYKIVKTVRKDNMKTSFLKKITSRIFYKTFSLLSGVDLSSGMADFRLLDRQVVNKIIENKEVSLFLRGLIEWVGYDSSVIAYTSNDRYSGKTKYSFIKMLKFAWTGITSFSTIPLRMGIVLGLFSSFYAFYRLGYAYYIKTYTDAAVPGWASIIGVLSLLFGILFILLGIIGEYIGRILIQVQGRDRYIISDKIES